MTRVGRRDFLKSLGGLVFFHKLGLCSPALSAFEICCSQEKSNTCFVGVGPHGYSIAMNLDWFFDDPEDPFEFSILMFERDYPRIPAHVNADSVVILCGSLQDETFWRARELVQALKPHFLISLVPEYFTPDLNEAVVVLDRSLSVEHWLIPYGGLWLGMDYVELKMVMAATTSNIIHYQAETLSPVPLKSFLTEKKDLLDRSHRVYCHFSIVYPEEVEIEKYAAALREQQPAEVLWEGHQAIRAGSKLEMHLVCSWRQYDR